MAAPFQNYDGGTFLTDLVVRPEFLNRLGPYSSDVVSGQGELLEPHQLTGNQQPSHHTRWKVHRLEAARKLSNASTSALHLTEVKI